MSDKPPYDELSELGKCIIDERVEKSNLAESLKKVSPSISGDAISALKETMREAPLSTLGIDKVARQDVVRGDERDCDHLVPSDTPIGSEKFYEALKKPGVEL